MKVYSGRKGNLPRKFISRQKLRLPAAAACWVNRFGGQPLLCMRKDYDPEQVSAIEHDVLKEPHATGVLTQPAPDPTATDNTSQPSVTSVFDREVWSQAMFARLARKGIASISWQKNFNGPPWAFGDCRSSVVTEHGPTHCHEHTVLHAGKTVELGNGLAVRQVRQRLECGREVAITTTHPTLCTEKVASMMFSRWSQENYFEYVRERFGLDKLTAHELATMDDDTMVVNPNWRSAGKRFRKLNGQLGTLRSRIAQGVRNGAVDRRGQQLAQEAERLSGGTRMVWAVAAAQGKKPNPRKALQTLFSADANIVPDHEHGTLTVQIIGLGNPTSSACSNRCLRN